MTKNDEILKEQITNHKECFYCEKSAIIDGSRELVCVNKNYQKFQACKKPKSKVKHYWDCCFKALEKHIKA